MFPIRIALPKLRWPRGLGRTAAQERDAQVCSIWHAKEPKPIPMWMLIPAPISPFSYGVEVSTGISPIATLLASFAGVLPYHQRTKRNLIWVLTRASVAGYCASAIRATPGTRSCLLPPTTTFAMSVLIQTGTADVTESLSSQVTSDSTQNPDWNLLSIPPEVILQIRVFQIHDNFLGTR